MCNYSLRSVILNANIFTNKLFVFLVIMQVLLQERRHGVLRIAWDTCLRSPTLTRTALRQWWVPFVANCLSCYFLCFFFSFLWGSCGIAKVICWVTYWCYVLIVGYKYCHCCRHISSILCVCVVCVRACVLVCLCAYGWFCLCVCVCIYQCLCLCQCMYALYAYGLVWVYIHVCFVRACPPPF